MQTEQVRYLDRFVFEWCKRTLAGASPEDIVAFYVDKFVFKNAEYFDEIVKLYKLPNDILKLHNKINALASRPREQQ